MTLLLLRNPHSVLASLARRPEAVQEIRLPVGKPAGAWAEVADVARSHQIPVVSVVQTAQGAKGHKSERQGVACAQVWEKPAVSLADLFESASSESTGAEKASGVWLALDCLQDPHNVGAIFRTAAFFGVRGIIVTKDRSAPLTATAWDVSAGGLEAIPYAQPANLQHAIQFAKEQGVWVLGSSEHAEKPLSAIPHDRPWLLLVGNEERGLRRLTLEACDEVCGIPAMGLVGSLNVSVATGIFLHTLKGGIPSISGNVAGESSVAGDAM